MAVEEPKFTVQSKAANYEVRKYPKILVAETLVQGNFEEAGKSAFRILADFIFGNNKQNKKMAMTAPVAQSTASQKIAMTAPVNQIKSEQGFLFQFTMPENFTLENIPEPNDPRVILRELPARTLAVFSYSGSWSESRYNEKLAEFRASLDMDKIATTGEPVFARFNSPFRLWFLRRNEIWLELAR